jgi:predicted acetyltransferase
LLLAASGKGLKRAHEQARVEEMTKERRRISRHQPFLAVVKEEFERYRTAGLDAGQVNSLNLAKAREEKETAEDLHLRLQLQDFHLKQADVEVVETFSLHGKDVKEEITAPASSYET